MLNFIIQRKICDAPQPKKRLTEAINAADSVTIKITAIDSLKSCCRLGQTTSFSSSTVELRKPFFGEGFSSSGGESEFGVS